MKKRCLIYVAAAVCVLFVGCGNKGEKTTSSEISASEESISVISQTSEDLVENTYDEIASNEAADTLPDTDKSTSQVNTSPSESSSSAQSNNSPSYDTATSSVSSQSQPANEAEMFNQDDTALLSDGSIQLPWIVFDD